MALNDLVSGVRALVRDTSADLYHYTDAQILSALADAVSALRSQNPVARYSEGTLTDLDWPADADLASFDPLVDRRWWLGLRYFAAGRIFETDTTDTVNAQLAADMFKKAQAEFMR